MLQVLRSSRTYAEPDSIGALTSGNCAFVGELELPVRARRFTDVFLPFPIFPKIQREVSKGYPRVNSVSGNPLRIQGRCHFATCYITPGEVPLTPSLASLFQAQERK